MGAETRARANVWATAMLVGGIFGLIIAASAPYVLSFFAQMFSGNNWNQSSFTCGGGGLTISGPITVTETGTLGGGSIVTPGTGGGTVVPPGGITT